MMGLPTKFSPQGDLLPGICASLTYGTSQQLGRGLLFAFVCFFVFGATAPQWARTSSFTRFLYHTQRRTTVGRTSLDELSASRKHLYLTTHNAQNRRTSMPPVGFEPTISAGERPQTYALDRAATGVDLQFTHMV